MKIYLAGGMKTEWRKKVKEFLPKHEYFDPSTDAQQNACYRWTSQELEFIDSCDLVLAYFERGNPSGLGMCLEIGYANKCGVPVILVDEHPRLNAMMCAL